MKKKALIAQIGARMHYAVPLMFNRRGLLSKLHTDFYLSKLEHKFLNYFKNISPLFVKMMLGRTTSGLPKDKIISNKLFGILYAIKLRRSKTRSDDTKNYLWAGKTICKNVLKDDISKFDVFYGFNTDSLEVLEKCKEYNIFSILEQTIAAKKLHNELLVEESKKWPLLEPTFTEGYVSDIIEREKKEWEYASIIICASDFVKNSLISEGVNKHKIHVIPYGVKKPIDYKKHARDYFHVIFVGNFGLRKGGIYFLEAAKLMAKKNIKFTVIGSIGLDTSILDKYKPYVNFTGSIPRDEVINYYLNADVMCLPSLCEGSATVSYESLSYGVPLITTYNSGTVIEDGKEGLIIPIRDSKAIVKSIELLSSNKNLLDKMSKNAKIKSYDYTWDKYEERLMNLIESHL